MVNTAAIQHVLMEINNVMRIISKNVLMAPGLISRSAMLVVKDIMSMEDGNMVVNKLVLLTTLNALIAILYLPALLMVLTG